MRKLLGLFFLTVVAAPQFAAALTPPTTGYYSVTYDTSKGTATLQLAGNIGISKSSTTLSTQNITLNGITGQIGVNQPSPSQGSVMDLVSTSSGVYIPRMTTSQRNAITGPGQGLQIYNTSTNKPDWYDGGTWNEVGTGGGDVNQSGTNNMTGSTTWAVSSTMTFAQGYTTSGSTITLTQHPVSTGTYTLQVSTNPANQTTMSFANLDANANYKLSIDTYTEITGGAGCFWEIQFNGVAASNTYLWIVNTLNSSGNAVTGNGSNSPTDTKAVLIYNSANGPPTGYSGSGWITFYTGSPASITEFNSEISTRDASNSRYHLNKTWGQFYGSAVTQITLFQPGGCVWTAGIRLFRT